MLLSRFWIAVLAVGAIGGVSAAMLARGAFNREDVAAIADALRRDRFEVEALLKLDARARLDAIAPMAANADVRKYVRVGRKASKTGKSDGPRNLKEKLRSLNKQLAGLEGDLVIAVGADGTIIAQVGRKEARPGAGLGKVPLVRGALSGYFGDDVWVYNGGVYRMAARPIVDGGRYIGALVHGQRLDAKLAQLLSERLGGASVGFFFRDRMIASHSPTDVVGAPSQTELEAQLASAISDEGLKKGERSATFDLSGRGLSVFSLVAGSASDVGVGYAIGRPYSQMETPFAIFDRTTKEDMDALPKGLLAGGVLLLIGLGMALIFVEHDRTLAAFRSDLTRLAEGRTNELPVADQKGPYRKLAELVNQAVEAHAGAQKPAKADLDEILGPEPENAASTAFSFGSDPGPMAAPPPGDPPAMPPPDAMGGGQPAPMPPPDAFASAQPAPMPPPDAMASAQPPPAPMPAPDQLASAAAQPAPNGNGQGGRAAQPAPAPAPMHPDDDEQTVVKEIPDELREAARAEDSHFRQVYDDYVKVKRECGENVDGLTFDKFAVTLRKNRDQILSKHEARDVKFTVYVKAGKAALKASPVRA